ncbi:hypothetical protein ONS96_001905 [Cadophora gregata f. sp. sojae]|nr:hypothetical protein ONS96_001905 [Cadophora gregata f. sp. sojae]
MSINSTAQQSHATVGNPKQSKPKQITTISSTQEGPGFQTALGTGIHIKVFGNSRGIWTSTIEFLVTHLKFGKFWSGLLLFWRQFKKGKIISLRRNAVGF